jgi:ferredoxin--NADP+ reductase
MTAPSGVSAPAPHEHSEVRMAYVITQNCCNDASCVAACPVDCIHPTPGEVGFATTDMLYIDPATCIDCGACADVCPVDAIRPDTELTSTMAPYREINASYYAEHPPSPALTPGATPAPLVTSATPLRVALVGSGPAAFYCATELLDHPGVHVTMFERLPAPYGLIRHGVAPDHPATKAITSRFRLSPDKARRFRLHLDTEIGTDLGRDDLLLDHHAVIYAHGAFLPRRLDIPGSNLPGCLPAGAFVGWYNDHPDHRDLDPSLHTGRRVAIVGNGNVALDAARILVSEPESLAETTIAPSALDALRNSTVDEVVVLGRRGPEDAAFTAPELLALIQSPDFDVEVDPAALPEDPSHLNDPRARRKIDLLTEIAGRPTTAGHKRIRLLFHTRPTEILGTSCTTGIRVRTASGETTFDTSLVLYSIGFTGTPIDGLPFDRATGTIPHRNGRVTDHTTDRPVAGIYTAGWAKRGATGVIGTNRTCAQETVDCLLADHAAGRLPIPRSQRPRAGL